MINLLPRDRQEMLLRRDWSKIAAIIWVSICAGLTAFILMLLAVKNFYEMRLESVEIALDAKKKEMEIFDVESIEERITFNNELIGQTNDFYSRQIKIGSIVDKIAASLPSDSFLYKFAYYSGEITMEGYLPDRNSLVEFKENLEACPEFFNVDFLSDNWLMAKDINFTANFEYGKKN